VASHEEFEDLVAEAVDELPAWVHERLENVDVLVEAHPPPGQPGLLGLYEGVPLTRRGSYNAALPDRITLFRSSIEATARHDGTPLKRVIAHTVVHEFAHFFGISDARLRELDAY
jgi:predicted Zn-dependent protease with MMP-like domain